MPPGPDISRGFQVLRGLRRGRWHACVLAAVLMLVPPAWAQFNTEDPEATVWTLDEAVARAEARYPGRVLSAHEDLTAFGNRVFLVRILTENQQVRTIRIEEGTEVE